MTFYSFDRTIIYLFGYPGVGKATIAAEISSLSNMIQIDNHKISNLLRDVAGDQADNLREPIKEAGAQVSKIVLDFMAAHCQTRSYVLTSVLYESDPFRKKWFEDFVAWTKKNGWKLVPVQIMCDLDVAQQRIQHKNRQDIHKLKDPDILADIYKEHVLLKANHLDGISVDVTSLSAQEAAKAIFDQVIK